MRSPYTQPIASGKWSDDVSWEFYLTTEAPPRELCTAVFCLALSTDGIVLTKTKRGWEMLGGHLETDETLEQGLLREAHEEAGYTPETYTLVGYRKINAVKPIMDRDGKSYPYPISYIPLFIAKSSKALEATHGDDGEILDSGVFTRPQLDALNVQSINIIDAVLDSSIARDFLSEIVS